MTTLVAPSKRVEFSVTETGTSDATTIVSVTGEVDLLTAPQLSAVLNRLMATDRSIVVDLSAVTFLESSGLAVLLRANEAASRAGGSFRLAGQLPEVVALLFELTKVTDHFVFEGAD